jgi:hypothetical protein
MANTSSSVHEPFTYRELHENGLPPTHLRREQWEGNYKEAAIFLEVSLGLFDYSTFKFYSKMDFQNELFSLPPPI